ncbi:MAG: UbiA family prenyltransferase [Chitinophagales bacterium]
MNLKKILRAQEWWSFILPPVFLFYYVGLLQFPRAGRSIYFEMITLMIVSVITAIIGYFINDLFDIHDDLKAGKKNYVSSFPLWLKALFFPLCISLLLILWLINQRLILVERASLYAVTCAANTMLFVVYSMPPIRFKKAIYIAPILDALYSGTLFYILAFILATQNTGNNTPMLCILIWAFCKGLRNYLSHLCDDKENDESSGMPTLATVYGKESLQKTANLLFPVEILCLLVLQTVLINTSYPFIILCLVFIVLWFQKMQENSSIKYPFLNELHEIYLPVAILVQVVFTFHSLYPMLILHFVFFPFHLSKMYFTIKNSIFKLFNKEPLSWKELLNGKK